jgi:hypothetical protein
MEGSRMPARTVTVVVLLVLFVVAGIHAVEKPGLLCAGGSSG